ncbi:response regulator transcription factor [Paenibacillus cymbidii]|uniref:response regulator transcription factor n=1 Tax=Paenibacillus cymbidii TaxID=1639034 RepID=UPI00108150CB|nr:response regulator transcription factor [Paenibacillus cymbidii]
MKIMLVEDDRTIADLVAETLSKWGFATVLATDFERVLPTFLAERPQLVLMDIGLPYYDGFYWCDRIREVSSVPIMFLSSRTTPMDMVMAMNRGGDDYVQKPFYTDVLLAKINALLRRAYAYVGTEADVLEHNGVALHVLSGQVVAGGGKTELTKTECVIMQQLMRSKGAIVSRTSLMRRLWEDESFVDDNTLTVNIARLRKKLAELGQEDFIATRKGQGYIVE